MKVHTFGCGLFALFLIHGPLGGSLQEWKSYFVDVQCAHMHNNGDFEDKVLWSGDTYYCSISDFQTIEKAISVNSFIVCVDKENYDIK